MIPIGVRTKAAACHLAAFTVIGIFLVPFVLGYIPDEEPDFSQSHRYGAMIYQLMGVVVFVIGGGLSTLPSIFLGNEFIAGAVVTFFWIVYLCALGLYLLGIIVLSIQALSGANFDFPPANRWVYDEE